MKLPTYIKTMYRLYSFINKDTYVSNSKEIHGILGITHYYDFRLTPFIIIKIK